MAKPNFNYAKLPGSYLFANIAHETAAYQEAHPEAKLIKMGIGDVTRPLAPAVIKGMKQSTILPPPSTSMGMVRSKATTSCAKRFWKTISRLAVSTSRLTRSSSRTVRKATAETSAICSTSTTSSPCAIPFTPFTWIRTPCQVVLENTMQPPKSGRTSCTCPLPQKTGSAPSFPKSTLTSCTFARRTIPRERFFPTSN